jgi:hypothetical protein
MQNGQSLRNVSSAAVALLLAMAFVGCRNEAGSGSEVQSLDNFAAGKQIEANVCGIDSPEPGRLARHVDEFERAGRIVASPEMKKIVLGTLEAVPPKLLSLFALDGGRVVVEPRAAARCEQALPKDLASARVHARERGAQAESIPACWLGQRGRNNLEIVIEDRPEIIRHALLRALAYYLVETRYLPVKGGRPQDVNVRSIAQSFAELSTSFLRDLKADGQSAQLQRLTKERSEAPGAFDLLVFAESIDSYYCSTKSRQIFETKFPSAYAVFVGDRNLARAFGAGR